MPSAPLETHDVGRVTEDLVASAFFQGPVDLSVEKTSDLGKRANPSGHISIPNRRTPISNSVVIGAVKVITYYTVQGVIEVIVQNLAPHASSYSIRHTPGGIIDGIVPRNMQDTWTNPRGFAPGDVLDVSAVPN
ncbi:Hypothetical protein D9617_115g089230 [Elsinoe fawcettii]|nr:Hypothetical protein D9617_115g089230 [Elsinoe fawcettii]